MIGSVKKNLVAFFWETLKIKLIRLSLYLVTQTEFDIRIANLTTSPFGIAEPHQTFFLDYEKVELF